MDEAVRWGPHAAKPGPRLGVSWGLWAPPGLVPGFSGEIEFLYFFGNFSEHFGFWTFSAMHRHNKQKVALGILSTRTTPRMLLWVSLKKFNKNHET